MSGGSLNYIAYQINDVLFRNVWSHYNRLDDEKECKLAREENPMRDEDVSELLFDMTCLLHSLEWCESGDTNNDYYNADLQKFKNKWLKNNS